MLLIAHRINKIRELINLNNKYGIEIDIRNYKNELIIEHDPFKKGVKLEKFLKYYNHKFLIANIKSERIEDRVIKLFRKFKIKNYFFLDSSFPKIIDLVKKKFNKISIRVSHYEGLTAAKKLKGKAKWIWYDTFLGIPKNFKDFKYLKYKLKYKICLVSPEISGNKVNKKSKQIIKLKKSNLIDAVCTKKNYFSNWI